MCFNSRSPSGERLTINVDGFVKIGFNSRSPSGERPRRAADLRMQCRFQLTLPERGATGIVGWFTAKRQFQLTLPERGATCTFRFWDHISGFNSRSPSGERRDGSAVGASPQRVSTHAPRAGSDLISNSFSLFLFGFNSRSPSGERRANKESYLITVCFNSRSPSGERLTTRDASSASNPFQLTLPERGATERPEPCGIIRIVSTHAPRAGSDKRWFQRLLVALAVSTHAPRAGSDATLGRSDTTNQSFNSRSPSGERRPAYGAQGGMGRFQLTLPERGATEFPVCTLSPQRFNSRSPSGERQRKQINRTTAPGFNSRSPSGERLPTAPRCSLLFVSTHAPRAGSDIDANSLRLGSSVSTHAPRAGSDFFARHISAKRDGVSTHAPRAGSDERSRWTYRN